MDFPMMPFPGQGTPLPPPPPGLLGALPQIDPQRQGLLAAAFQGLQASGPSRTPVSFGQTLGQAGQAGMQAQRQAQNDQLHQQQVGMQSQMMGLQYAQAQEALRQKQQLQALIPAFQKDPAAMLMAQAGDFKGAIERIYPKAEYDLKEMMGPDGKPTYGYFPKNPGAGAITSSGVSPVPKLHFADTGAGIVPLDQSTGATVGPMLPKTVTPGERLTDERTRSEGAANRGVTLRGQNMTDARAGLQFDPERGVVVDTRSGTAAPVQMGGAPLGQKDKPLTEVQGKATAFALRQDDANKVIQSLEGKKGFDPAAVSSQLAGQSGMKAPLNYMASADAQRYEQAKRNWVTANLRLESGAAIPDAELAQEYRKWFPIPGDGPEVIKQKSEARKVAEQAIKVQAGTGLSKVPQKAPEGKTVVRRGTYQGKSVVEYSDGTVAYE